MTELITYSLLRVSALQIAQSAGFEATHPQPSNILADVLVQYLTLLGSTARQFAELGGRQVVNAYDVGHGLMELGVDVESLRAWTEDGSGKELANGSVATSTVVKAAEQVLRGLLTSGRDGDGDDTNCVYEYREISSDEMLQLHDDMGLVTKYASEEHMDVDEMDDTDNMDIAPRLEHSSQDSILYGEQNHGAPSSIDNIRKYIPSFLPPFPSIEDNPKSPKLVPLPPPPEPEPDKEPLILASPKLKKVPPRNPFKEIIPFQESALVRDSEQYRLQPGLPPKKKPQKASTGKIFERSFATLSSSNSIKINPLFSPSAINNRKHGLAEAAAAPPDTLFVEPGGTIHEIVGETTPASIRARLEEVNLRDGLEKQLGEVVPEVSTASAKASSTTGSKLSAKAPPPATSISPAIQAVPPAAPPTTVRRPSVPSVPTPTHQKAKTETVSPPEPTIKRKPSLHINLSNIPKQTGPPSATATPKIRFKITTPVAATPKRESIEEVILPAAEIEEDEEIINCVCDMPQWNDGSFMIACDRCQVWFHGRCVKISEINAPETWYCPRCKGKGKSKA